MQQPRAPRDPAQLLQAQGSSQPMIAFVAPLASGLLSLRRHCDRPIDAAADFWVPPSRSRQTGRGGTTAIPRLRSCWIDWIRFLANARATAHPTGGGVDAGTRVTSQFGDEQLSSRRRPALFRIHA